MGSLGDWIWVLALAAFWVAAEWLFTPQPWALSSRRKLPRTLRFWNYVGMTSCGLLFGMGMVFKWRVLHGGLLPIFVLLAAVFTVSGLIWWRARRKKTFEMSSSASESDDSTGI